jgi:hypothetical protein
MTTRLDAPGRGSASRVVGAAQLGGRCALNSRSPV